MSEKKQIEEIRKDIFAAFGGYAKWEEDWQSLAEAVYNAGYRKQSEGEWISVENPPDEYRDEYGELIPFLACCKGTVYPFRAVYDGKNWGDGIGVLEVTHWMPLPEPPVMKGGE